MTIRKIDIRHFFMATSQHNLLVPWCG
jgi:hypothetical protein